MRNYVQSSARAQFRVANAAIALTVGLGIAAATTRGKKQIAFAIATTAMGTYAGKARAYAHEFNDKLAAELSPEFREMQEQVNNNKLFIW